MATTLVLERGLPSEDRLPVNLTEADRGHTWWVGFTWFIWTGTGWLKTIATRTGPGER